MSESRCPPSAPIADWFEQNSATVILAEDHIICYLWPLPPPWLDMRPLGFPPQLTATALLASLSVTRKTLDLGGKGGGQYCGHNKKWFWCDQWIIAGTKEHFESHTHPHPPPKKTSARSGGYHPSIQSIGAELKASCGALGGYFRRRRPWLWRLWHQLCFLPRLLKNGIKTLKLVVCKQQFISNYTL